MNLIVGGSGNLGHAIARRLLSAGEPVRVMTRSPERAADLKTEGAEIVRGDLLERASLAMACQGAERVVAAAHSILGRGRAASIHVDGAGHRDLIDAAKSAGVRHFVYTSVYDYAPEYHDIPFFRIKYDVEEYLKTSGLSYTILRPTAFMESHAHVLIGEPILRNGKTVLFGKGEQLRNFVAADDVARFAVLALKDPVLAGQTIAIGGPENLSNMDVVRIYERATGRSARITRVPLGVLRVAWRLAHLLHPGLSQVIRAGILGDTTDQRFDAQPLQEQFDVELVQLEQWVAQRAGVPASATTRPV